MVKSSNEWKKVSAICQPSLLFLWSLFYLMMQLQLLVALVHFLIIKLTRLQNLFYMFGLYNPVRSWVDIALILFILN